MTTLLQRGLTKLARAVPQAAGRAATLSRRGVTCSLSVVLTSPGGGVLNESGVLLTWEGVDVLCAAADYAPGGTVSEPAAGDRLSVGTSVYEVVQPSMGQQCFSYRDPPDNTMLRVHAKRVA
jgi:hypothetical protein